MIIECIIFGVFIFAAFYSGFYFGHMKRENKPPESMPYTPITEYMETKFNQVIEKVESTKRQEDEDNPTGFFE